MRCSCCLMTALLLLFGLEPVAFGFEVTRQSVIFLQVRNDEPAAQASLQASGAFLADCLGQMTGLQLPVRPAADPPREGICLAVVPGAPQEAPGKAGALERYVIEADDRLLRISSLSAAGVQDGVMAFLREQGCRWLLPSPKWWVIPKTAKVSFTGRRESAPGYASRRIWYAYGPGTLPELGKWYAVWAQANQLGGARPFATGHSYGGIIGRHAADFAQHPDYYAKDRNGKVDPAKVPAAQKFCYSNPGLRELCLRDRLALLTTERAQNPLAFMVSMDPSDGEGTCYCPECAALGTTTDRVISLANYVAGGLREQAPGAWVGLYAYSSHRAPPTIRLEPNIHVEVAMAFNTTGLSYDELIRQWGEKAGSLGIREYYGVEAWDWGLPGRMRGGNVAYHRKMIPFFLQHGAVSVNAETNANWGGQALGLYVAARLLWDPAANVDAVVDEFLSAAFGTAAPQMRKLYDAFETAPTLGIGGRARLLDLASAGLRATDDPACRARITDILAYLVYLDYYMCFQSRADGTEDYFAALSELMTYAHRIEGRNVVHAYALARRLCNANVKERRPEFLFNGRDVIWKQGAPYSDAEIVAMAAALRAGYAAALADRVGYSRDLVLVHARPTAPAPMRVGFRYRNTFYLQSPAGGDYTLAFEPADGQKITGSLAPHPAGDAVREFNLAEAGRQAVGIVLQAGRLYRLELATGGASSTVTFPDGLAVALEASEERPCWMDGGGPFVVMVPAKTAEIRCQGTPRLSLISPRGERTDVTPVLCKAGDEFARIPVPTADAGCAWQVGAQTRGAAAFFNIPPLIQLNSRYLLLPKEAANEFGMK